MHLINLKNYLSSNRLNAKGKKISSKIVVIESDDWGTVRMSSKDAFSKLSSKGYNLNDCSYNSNDALESNKDLDLLFDLLYTMKGADGNPAKLTANMIVANPDFEKIKASDFRTYYYEPFTSTLARYPDHNNVMDIYKKGKAQGVVMPQFHGREHVHISHWLEGLQNRVPKAVDAFEQNMFSVFTGSGSNCNNEYLNAMAYYSIQQEHIVKESVESGLKLFSKIWGFESESLIAPCYQWHSGLEKTFFDNNVKIIQGGRAQISPNSEGEPQTVIRHYNGSRNIYGQIFTIRNVLFEPSSNLNKDWVDSALREISNAFFWKQPAIISSHRVNYIGWINENNRSRNLKLLSQLIKKITSKWPDVIFISSDQMTKYY